MNMTDAPAPLNATNTRRGMCVASKSHRVHLVTGIGLHRDSMQFFVVKLVVAPTSLHFTPRAWRSRSARSAFVEHHPRRRRSAHCFVDRFPHLRGMLAGDQAIADQILHGRYHD